MCGIAGNIGNLHFQELHLRNMLTSIKHRGPDQTSIFQEGQLQSGMVRLSINDLDSGDQPLSNDDHTINVMYNGEIYNYPQLKKHLAQLGICPQNNSDGSVIPYLFELYGTKAFSMLNGMYAISLWDSKEESLYLVRDLCGEKPLYYSIMNNSLTYASELKAFRFDSNVSNKLNSQAIWDMPTFLWIPEPETIYEEIQSLPKGHVLKYSQGKINITPFEYNDTTPDITSWSQSDKLNYIHDIVTQVIKDRLISDVPVGCFLSGGLDSSIITSIASKNLDNLNTFTIGFDDSQDLYHGNADESQDAAYLANILGTTHHTIRVSEADFRNQLDDLTTFGDQPFAVSSGLGILSISKLAKAKGIKVLLSGDGADESFGGYSWYQHLQSSKITGNKYDLGLDYQSLNVTQKEKVLAISKLNPTGQQFAWHYYASENLKSQLFSSDFSNHCLDSKRYFNEYKEGSWEPMDFIHQDRDFYFPNEMLKKADRMSMGHSVEIRAPFAAPEIQSLSSQLTYADCVDGSQLKHLLRSAFKNELPMEVINRPKHGFNVPIDYWLQGKWNDLVEETFDSNSMLSQFGLLNSHSLKNAQELVHSKKHINGHSIFSFIMLNKWLVQNKSHISI